MNDRIAREICEDKLKSIAEELDESSKERAFQLLAMFSDFLLQNMKGAGSIPVSPTGSTTPGVGMICPKCSQTIKVLLS